MIQLNVGQVFAEYTLEGVLGRGGMGTVYLARHPRLPRQVALKLLAPEVSSDEELRRRFDREANAIARLEHPNIVGIHDRGVHGGQLWIAMQYVSGSDASRLNPRELSVGRAAKIIVETAAALDYAHSRGIVHRDVKPANILLSSADTGRDERAILTDFGIARLQDANTQLTSAGTVTATLAYASPEQLSGGTVDHRSDQYSLACTLFALLAGQPPFSADNPGQVVAGHLARPIPQLTGFRSDVAPALDSVLARATSKRPEDRFVSCSEFATAVAAAAWQPTVSARSAPTVVAPDSTPTHVYPSQPQHPVPEPWQRLSGPEVSGIPRRWVLGAGAAAISASVVGVGGVILSRRGEASTTAGPSAILDCGGEIRRLAFSPDDGTLAVATGAAGGFVQLWELRTRTQIGHFALSSVTAFGFSPDGSSVVATGMVPGFGFFDSRTGRSLGPLRYPSPPLPDAQQFSADRSLLALASGGELSLWDTRTGQKSGGSISTDELVKHIAFSSDGSMIAFVEKRRQADKVRVWLYDTVSRQSICPPIDLDNDVMSLRFSPDGRTLSAATYFTGVRLWSVPSGKPAAALDAKIDADSLAFSPDGRRVATAIRNDDSRIYLWDTANWSRLPIPINEKANKITALEFSSSGSVLASGGSDRFVRLWDLNRGN
ncbi:WD40 repeat domain-containing serine/threonine protein kinase [Nocardia sp. NPDC005746]|uniref:WD40 repeat domain-containing serine/threonine protein kinase n=1 Tax=Nocardia sp. NPDC005746 TaxID=3157062 RepID=UPI003408C4B5